MCANLLAFPLTTGTYYDSGGPNGNYGNLEKSEQFVECADSFGTISIQLVQLTVDVSDCSTDILNIYDGPSISSPSLFSSSCGTPFVSASSPLVFYSSTSQAVIRFMSDNSGNDAGYTIKYTCAEVTSVTAINGTLYDTGGAGGQYGNNENAFTRLTCPMGQGPQLSFTELDIDGTMPSCSTDSLKIISGGEVKNTYCGTLTGSSLPQLSVGASSALILFTSDGTVTKAGYVLTYECVLITSGKFDMFL